MNLANALIWKLLQLITSMRALTCLGTRSLMRLGLLANIYQLLQGITASRVSGLHCCGSFCLWWEACSGIIRPTWLFCTFRQALFVYCLFKFHRTTTPFASLSPLAFVWRNRNVLLCLSWVDMYHNFLCRRLSLKIWPYPLGFVSFVVYENWRTW